MHNLLLRHLSPWMYPIVGFSLLIMAGTVSLVLLPMREGGHLPFIDALFLATSATCVTGLSVLDIGAQLTLWGQLTILLLIQLGGLGIMCISTVLLLVLRGNISFRSRFLVQDTFSHGPQADLPLLLRNVIRFTLLFETLGGILLFFRFKEDFSTLTAVYQALFHAVSAFCNAGFGLFADSLMRYHDDVLINLTVAGLIIVGGIGFLVLHEMMDLYRRREPARRSWRRLSLHSKLVIWMTGLLLVSGTLFFLGSEWSFTLSRLSLGNKCLAAFFQSVTTRTAGFNTLDFAAMNNLTLLGSIMLMFVGASPGSTGGGIKTSTLGVLLAFSRSRLSGSTQVHAFKRSIPIATVGRAFSVVVLSMAVVVVGTAGLLIAEMGTASVAASRGQVLELFFETTSAFGTVGLSMGVTSSLSFWSKFILVAIMFTGRLGPLVIATAIQFKEPKGSFVYAQERVMIG
jgi:trk system potassium uptake protein